MLLIPSVLLALAAFTGNGVVALDLIDDAKTRGAELAAITLEQDGYRDKKRLCLNLEEYFDGEPPKKRAAKKAARKLDRWLRSQKSPHVLWRGHELRGRLLVKTDPKAGLGAFEEAVDAYPNADYAYPSKQSFFHHLLNEAAMARIDVKGVKSAEAMLVRYAKADERMQALYLGPLEARYLADGLEEELAALRLRLGAALEAKAASGRSEEASGEASAESPALHEGTRAVGGDVRKRYILLGDPESQAGARSKDLVLVLPGGSGQAGDFEPWVTRIAKPLMDRYVFAILYAPTWSDRQAKEWVWVTKGVKKRYGAEFSVESFASEVAAELRSNKKLRLKDAFLFAWSSGGPAAYATVLAGDSPFAGAYVLSSVFKPDRLDLDQAEGKRFWIEQGRSDRTTPFRFAEAAAQDLASNGAKTQLKAFEGGHGFDMPDPASSLRAALRWLSSGK